MKKMTFIALLCSFIFIFNSCKFQTNVNDDNNKIILEEGTNEFDKKTLYLRANHPESVPQVAKDRKDTLIIGIPAVGGIFNPLFWISTNDIDIINAVWDPILDIGSEGKIVEGIAYFPEIDEENKTYTFRLKDNLKWEDGKEITSYDIEFTFKVLMDKTYTGTFERDNFDVLGWENYRDGITENIEGFKIIDDKNFKIIFNSINSKKNYYFERIRPLALHVYGVDYVQGNAQELEKYNKTPFGNGAYKFESYSEGEEVRLTSNEYYYKGQAIIPNLVFRVVSHNNQLQLLENGDIDIIKRNVNANQENIEILNNLGFVEAVITSYLGYGYMAINHKESIMQDKDLRQALAYGFDRESVVEICFGQFGSTLDIPQNKDSLFYPDDENFTKYEYNPEKAKELLEKSGWEIGLDGIREKDGNKLTLKFLASPNEVNDTLIPIMIENYKDIGIKIVVEQMELNTLLQKQKDANQGKFSYHLAFLFTPFANSDPDASSRFSTNGPSNRTGYSNEIVDKLLYDSLNEMNEDKKKELYAELYKVLSDDLPCIFLFEKMNFDVYSSRVKGIKNVSSNRNFGKILNELYLE